MTPIEEFRFRKESLRNQFSGCRCFMCTKLPVILALLGFVAIAFIVWVGNKG